MEVMSRKRIDLHQYTQIPFNEHFIFKPYVDTHPTRFHVNLEFGGIYAENSFYKEALRLHDSGLLHEDRHFKVLEYCMLNPGVLTDYKKNMLCETYTPEVIKGAYLIADALGMYRIQTELGFIKKYKRKNEIE